MSVSKEKKIELEDMRRRSILDAAFPLFFYYGYKKTTIVDIAKAAGISKGLVYHYFDNKEEILFSYKQSLFDCLEEISNIKNSTEALLEFGRRFISEPDQASSPHPLQVYVLVYLRKEIDEVRYPNPITTDFIVNYFSEIFKKGISKGELKDGKPEVLSYLFWDFLIGLISNNHPTSNGLISKVVLEKMIFLLKA